MSNFINLYASMHADAEPTIRLANKLNLKVADLAAIEGDYYKSISKYESVAKTSVSNNLMKCKSISELSAIKLTSNVGGSVKDYFLKAGICHLATTDMVALQRALESYRDLDPTFAR